MNELVSVRTNILYKKKVKKEESKDEEFTRIQELIFLVDKPTYRFSNEGEVIRERGLTQLRFLVTENSFMQMMKILETLKNVEESDLK